MAAKTTFQLIKVKDFIRVRRNGEPDLDESKRLLVELATMTEHPADYDILIDCRRAYGRLTYSDVYELVLELCKHRSAFHNKIALLTRTDSQFDKASFLELFARARGFKVGAFTDFEETIEWLSETAEHTPIRSETTSRDEA